LAGKHVGLDRNGGRILRTVHLIDDDASFRAAMKRRLQLAGFNVRDYATAEQFLERGDDGHCQSCFVLDVDMPGMSGLELQRCLGERGSTVPILFVTGRADEGVGLKAIGAGAADFLTKPVSSDHLIRSIIAATAPQDTARLQAKTPPQDTVDLQRQHGKRLPLFANVTCPKHAVGRV